MANGLSEAGAALAIVRRNTTKSEQAVVDLESRGIKAISVTTCAGSCAWAADNIQVNAILPGWIDTDLTKRARAEIDGLHDRVLARTPAARWGEISDFAGIAVFLASPASDFVTGTAIPVDGGYSIMG
jgi:NAD(P)-dependent dehydrogenase (short-subunit alcohol dehydrogenase family)